MCTRSCSPFLPRLFHTYSGGAPYWHQKNTLSLGKLSMQVILWLFFKTMSLIKQSPYAIHTSHLVQYLATLHASQCAVTHHIATVLLHLCSVDNTGGCYIIFHYFCYIIFMRFLFGMLHFWSDFWRATCTCWNGGEKYTCHVPWQMQQKPQKTLVRIVTFKTSWYANR